MSFLDRLRGGATGGRLLTAETSHEGDRVTTLELFFDLVYVFAFTQVTTLMSGRPDALGVVEGLVMLALLWAPWTSFAWLANQAHANRGVVRIGLVTATVVMFVAALAVPAAFRDAHASMLGAIVLVVCFVLVQVIHAVVYLVAAGDDTGLRRQIIISDTAGLVPAAVLLVIGGIVGQPFQVWIWLVAAAVMWLVIWLTSNGGNWRIQSMAHFAERHALVVLLAIGESVVAVGAGVAHEELGGAVIGGAVMGVLIAFGLWWTYFDHLAGKAERELSRMLPSTRRVGAATDSYTYYHLALVAGIVLVALGIERIMEGVAHADPAGWFTAIALGAGASLYLAGTAFFWRRVSGEWALPRLGGAVLSLLVIPIVALTPALVGLAVGLAALAALVVVEQVLGRHGEWLTARGRVPVD
jgi:low temperature requirement protein LtrA